MYELFLFCTSRVSDILFLIYLYYYYLSFLNVNYFECIYAEGLNINKMTMNERPNASSMIRFAEMLIAASCIAVYVRFLVPLRDGSILSFLEVWFTYIKIKTR